MKQEDCQFSDILYRYVPLPTILLFAILAIESGMSNAVGNLLIAIGVDALVEDVKPRAEFPQGSIELWVVSLLNLKYIHV